MRKWYLAKIRYTKEVEGKLKKVVEPYLVDALSFTEAEGRIHKEMEGVVRGEFEVSDIRPQNIADIFHHEDSADWYLAKVVYVTCDEESGKEKKSTHKMMVTADDLRQAYDRIKEGLKDLMVDFDIPEIKHTDIIDIFPYYTDSEIEELDVDAETMEEVQGYLSLGLDFTTMCSNSKYRPVQIGDAMTKIHYEANKNLQDSGG